MKKRFEQAVLMLGALAIIGSSGVADAGQGGGPALVNAQVTAQSTALGSSNDAIPNGRPFQALYDLITENRDLIEDNQDAISDLQTDVADINLRIDSIEFDLAEVTAQVAANMIDINEAFVLIAAAEGDIEALRIDLTALAAEHQADMAALETRLAAINVEISNLASQSAALAALLDTRVAELRALIDNNAVGIDGLLVDVALINAQLTTINSNYNLLTNQVNSLTTQIASYDQQIYNLEVALDALKSRVDMYHDPCLESIDVGQTITGQVDNTSECTSDSRNNGGTHGAQYYTFTLSSTSIVTITMEGDQDWSSCSVGGTLYDPYLYLHAGGRDGSVITSNDDGLCGFNSKIAMSLSPGTYTIEATSYYYTQNGTFRLSVQ